MPCEKSVLKTAITRDGSARLIISDSTAVVNTAAHLHNCSKTVSAALGRVLTAAALMGSTLKDEDSSLTLRFSGDGPAGNIVCVSDSFGNVRGFCENPFVELPPNSIGKLDVGGAVGRSGSLYVIKDMGMDRPYIGTTPLVSGEIAEDVTEYFSVSEQTPTACALGVRMSQERRCIGAGGYLLQLLPFADPDIIPVLERNTAAIPSLSALIAQGHTPDEIAAILFEGIEYDMLEEHEIEYRCTCSRERYASALSALGPEELEELKKGELPLEISCQFCGKKYYFDMEDLEKLSSDC